MTQTARYHHGDLHATLLQEANTLLNEQGIEGLSLRKLAERAGVSLPTIQRMEASEGVVRGVVDTLMKVVQAINDSGVELIGEGQASERGGRGVRLKAPASTDG